MQTWMAGFRRVFQGSLAAVLAIVLSGLAVVGFAAPSSASPSELTPDEQIDRAYELSTSTGLEEEIYQERLQEGQDPEAMPKPFRRVRDAEGRAVPETSLLEKTIDKAREAVDDRKGK